MTEKSKSEPDNHLFVDFGIGLSPAYLQRCYSLMLLLTVETAKGEYGMLEALAI